MPDLVDYLVLSNQAITKKKNEKSKFIHKCLRDLNNGHWVIIPNIAS